MRYHDGWGRIFNLKWETRRTSLKNPPLSAKCKIGSRILMGLPDDATAGEEDVADGDTDGDGTADAQAGDGPADGTRDPRLPHLG